MANFKRQQRGSNSLHTFVKFKLWKAFNSTDNKSKFSFLDEITELGIWTEICSMNFSQKPSKFPHFWEARYCCFPPSFSIKNSPTYLISQSLLAIRETLSLFIVEKSRLNMLLSLELAVVELSNTNVALACTFWYFGASGLSSFGLAAQPVMCFHNSCLLKGPSQPHLCFCLHARIWLLCFIRSLSKQRKITVKLLKIIKHTFRSTAYSKTIRIRFAMLY